MYFVYEWTNFESRFLLTSVYSEVRYYRYKKFGATRINLHFRISDDAFFVDGWMYMAKYPYDNTAYS